MKINLLYIIWFLALGAFFFIAKHLQQQSGQQLFGIAETEGQILKIDFPVFVKKVNVKTGMQVKKGDTLMLLYRSEFDKMTTEKLSQINQLELERSAKNTGIEKDAELFSVRQTARISDLQSQIKVLQSEIAVQNAIKQALSPNASSENRMKLQEIASLEEAIRQVNVQTVEQKKLFDSQRISNNTISTSKAQQLQNEIGFIGKEKTKLVLFAPCDGFVEQVFVMENEFAPNYKEMVKINPQLPNKVIGFVHESLNTPYRLGDSVLLTSSLRPTVKCKAQLVGVSPKLVELPFRLRKYSEVKTWGRELYLNLPPQNDFFIGEKILITIK